MEPVQPIHILRIIQSKNMRRSFNLQFIHADLFTMVILV